MPKRAKRPHIEWLYKAGEDELSYEPTAAGYEKIISERLKNWRSKK